MIILTPDQGCYMMAWGILLRLRVRFFEWVVSPRPTVLRSAVNLVNIVLFRQTNHVIQASGYIFLLSLSIAMNLTMYAVKCKPRVCDHLDHESTDFDPRSGCVPYHAQTGPDALIT